MADKIQIRRDTAASWTATNPILSEGELGLETDTGKIKAGNGSSTWTTLGYITDVAATGDTVDALIALGNYDGTHWSHYISSAMSYDGTNWSGINNYNGEFPLTADFIDAGQGLFTFAVQHVAAGNGRVVYLYTGWNAGYFNSFLLSAPNADVLPTIIRETTFNQNENPAFYFHWQTVFFQGGYFIAVGSQFDDNIGQYVPAFIYSTDGDTWTQGDVDIEWAIVTLWNSGSNAPGSSGIKITDVAYNDSGWFFTFAWEYLGSSASDLAGPIGGCYITALSTTLASTNYSQPWNAYLGFSDSARYVAWNGKTWISAIGDTENIFLNANLSPLEGYWTTRPYYTESNENIINITGWTPNRWPLGIASVDGGVIGDDTVLAISNNYGQIHISTDQGRTWELTVPDPRKGLVATLAADGSNNIYLTINDDFSRRYDFADYITIGPVSISGATGETNLNDTWVVEYDEGVSGWYLYQTDGTTNVTTEDLNILAYDEGSATITSQADGITGWNPESMIYANGALYLINEASKIFRWTSFDTGWELLTELDKNYDNYWLGLALCYGSIERNVSELSNTYDGRLNRNVVLGDRAFIDFNGSGPQYIGTPKASDENRNEFIDTRYGAGDPALLDSATINLGWEHSGKTIHINTANGNASTITIPPHDLVGLPTGYTVYINVVGTNAPVFVEAFTDNLNQDIFTIPVMVLPDNSYTPTAGTDGVAGIYTLQKIDNHLWSFTGPSVFNNI